MHIDGFAQGLLVDLQYALSIETGFSHQVELQPYARAIQSVYYGDVGMAALFEPRVNLSGVIQVAPITEASAIIVGKAGTPRLNSISELSRKMPVTCAVQNTAPVLIMPLSSPKSQSIPCNKHYQYC